MERFTSNKLASKNTETGIIDDDTGFVTPKLRQNRPWYKDVDFRIMAGSVVERSLSAILMPVDRLNDTDMLNPVHLAKEFDSYAPDGVLQVGLNTSCNLLLLDTSNLKSTKPLLRLT